MSSMSSRIIERVVQAKQIHGPIIRLIGTVDIDGAGTEHELAQVDPFILLDTGTITRHNFPPFGAHPHRGHSVVTILLNGSVKSWDSFRPKDQFHVIRAPASYWVDAGSGVFHDERSVMDDETDPSQHMTIFQLWIGVKEADRLKAPRVQYDSNLPTFDCIGTITTNQEEQFVVGKGIHFVGDQTTLETPHPITVAHITQTAGTTYRVPIVPDHGGFVISIKGNASFGGTPALEDNNVMVLANMIDDDTKSDADYLQVQTRDDTPAEYLVCSGERIREPWVKKLVANGAIIAATADEARELAPKVEEMAKAGKVNENGGSFAPFGMEV